MPLLHHHFLLFSIIYLVLLHLTNASSSVDEITTQNFKTNLAQYEDTGYLLAFTAPWCGHCARFAPVIESVADTLNDAAANDDDKSPLERIGVGKVDATLEPVLTSMFDVKGYPEIYYIRGWEIREYKGPRTHDGLVTFCKDTYKQIEPIPFLYSPFGPIGQFRLAVIYAGTAAVNFYEWVVYGPLGLSQKMAIGFLVLSALTIGVIFIVWAIVVTEERHLKRD